MIDFDVTNRGKNITKNNKIIKKLSIFAPNSDFPNSILLQQSVVDLRHFKKWNLFDETSSGCKNT